jgi:hypothetical protein
MARHFGDILLGMEIVRIEERPAQTFGEQPADSRFSRARNSEEHNDGDWMIHDHDG